LGSARTVISYHEESGFISADSILCTLPKENIKEIYSYILQQNYDMKGLSFSIKNNDIILSTLMFDKYFHKESGYRILENLIVVSNDQDDILINKFKAIKSIY
jgi:serine protease Do